MRFSYLLDKIRNAPFTAEPYTHIQLNDFFSKEDFAAITGAPEIATVDLKSDEDLFDSLLGGGGGGLQNHRVSRLYSRPGSLH